MKKIASVISLLTIMFLAAFTPVYATTGGGGEDICATAGANFAGLCKIRIESGGGGIVGSIVSALLIIAIIVSLVFLVLGGLRWTASGGDKGKIDSARSTIIAAIVGLVISLAAFLILNIILYMITGQSVSGMSIPRLID